MNNPTKKILLAEDSPQDAEMTMEVLRIIKNDVNLRTLPVVMLTASREEQDVVKSYQLGVNAYVVKPVGFQKFVEAVKQVGAFWTIHNKPPPGA